MILLNDDKRPIICIIINADVQSGYAVGRQDVTKIEPYQETGDNAYVNWFGIYKDDIIIARVNAQYVSQVFYS